MAILATASIVTVNNKAKNLAAMKNAVEEAAKHEAKLIVFPELCLQGLTPSMMVVDQEHAHYQHDHAELVPNGDSTQEFVKLAKQHDMYICWSMTEQSEKDLAILYNTAVLVGPEGYIGKYRKVHNPLTERLYFFPGDEYPVFNTKIGKIGLMTCYDLAFPEVARALTLRGAEIILAPTGWPVIRKDENDEQLFMYDVFSFARASENMVVLITSTVAGEYNGVYGAGHSRIIGPMPHQIFAETGFEEGIAFADVDAKKEILNAKLDAMFMSNLLKDRRPDTYEALTKVSENNFVFGKDTFLEDGE